MEDIEIFTDIGSTEEEINEKYPPQNKFDKIHIWLYQNKFLLIIICLLIIFYLLNDRDDNTQIENTPLPTQSGGGRKSFKQSGGGSMAKLASPVSSTFGIVTGALGKVLRFFMLIITIILIPTIPIVLYCLVAYYIIKKFLFMVTTIK